MSDILEEMVAAHWNDIHPNAVKPWSHDWDAAYRHRHRAAMCGALLMLAEAKLPDDLMLSIDAGLRDQEAFRCILRSIAGRSIEEPQRSEGDDAAAEDAEPA
jgi:hypothetical protein